MIHLSKISVRNLTRFPLIVRGLGLLAVVSIAGCGNTLDPQEYGKVIFEVPKVEGADAPYPLPELDVPEGEDGK